MSRWFLISGCKHHKFHPYNFYTGKWPHGKPLSRKSRTFDRQQVVISPAEHEAGTYNTVNSSIINYLKLPSFYAICILYLPRRQTRSDKASLHLNWCHREQHLVFLVNWIVCGVWMWSSLFESTCSPSYQERFQVKDMENTQVIWLIKYSLLWLVPNLLLALSAVLHYHFHLHPACQRSIMSSYPSGAAW